MRWTGLGLALACVLAVACGGEEFAAKTSTGGGGSAGATGGSAGAAGSGSAAGSGGTTGGAGGAGGAVGGSGGAGGAVGGAGGAVGGAGGAVGGAGGAVGGAGGAGGGAGGAGGALGGAGGAVGGAGGAVGGAGGATGGSGGATGGSGGGPPCVTQGTKPAPVGNETVLAITADIQPEYPVVSGGHVYWTTNLTLWRVDVAGTCLQNIHTVSSGQLEGIAVDSGYVYVANTSAGIVFRVPITGGAAQTLISNQAAQTVAVDATHVYYALPGAGIGRAPKAGGAMQIVATTGASQSFAIAVDANYVFAATRNSTLIRIPKGTNQPATQIDQAAGSVINSADPVHIALYGNRVFWTHWLNSPDSGAIRSVEKDSSLPAWLNESHPEGIATDGTSAYWALSYSGNGSIRKGSVALSSPITLVSGQARPRGVAIDATHVYWTNFDDRTVRRILR